MEIYVYLVLIIFIYSITGFKPHHYAMYRLDCQNPDISKWKIRVAFYLTSVIMAIAFPITIPHYYYSKWRKHRANKTQQG